MGNGKCGMEMDVDVDVHVEDTTYTIHMKG